MAAAAMATFLTIPRELRDMIYEDVMTYRAAPPGPNTPYDQVKPGAFRGVTIPQHEPPLNGHERVVGMLSGDVDQPPDHQGREGMPVHNARTKLMLLCKQTQAEAWQHLLRERQRPFVATLHIICRHDNIWPNWTRFPLNLISGRRATLEVVIHYHDVMKLMKTHALELIAMALKMQHSIGLCRCLDENMLPVPVTELSWEALSIQLLNEDIYMRDYAQQLIDKEFKAQKRGMPVEIDGETFRSYVEALSA